MERDLVPSEKRSGKRDKEKRILISLVEYYLKNGKPVGSNTLKEVGFPDLSSATIRNYFASLEQDGFLKQHHTSSGREPTEQAFRLYANECLQQSLEELEQNPILEAATQATTASPEPQDLKAVALFLHRAAEEVAERSQCAAFITSPRFDQDFVSDLKLIAIDTSRAMAIIVTHFGQVFSELLHAPHKLSNHAIKRIENYFQSRLMGIEMQGEPMLPEEHELAVRFYQETMARYLVSYANFSQEDIICTGFSKLLRYPEFQEAESLASSLSLFENQTALRALAREVQRHDKMKCWIGEELFAFLSSKPNCCLIAAPYSIGHKKVGAVGIIGPLRLPYKRLFSIIDAQSREISRFLEKSLYKHKLSFRTPTTPGYVLDMQVSKQLTGPKKQSLLEDQTKENHYDI